ncbi:hypothetical protein D3C83_247530 [compost metagenome]
MVKFDALGALCGRKRKFGDLNAGRLAGDPYLSIGCIERLRHRQIVHIVRRGKGAVEDAAYARL